MNFCVFFGAAKPLKYCNNIDYSNDASANFVMQFFDINSLNSNPYQTDTLICVALITVLNIIETFCVRPSA